MLFYAVFKACVALQKGPRYEGEKESVRERVRKIVRESSCWSVVWRAVRGRAGRSMMTGEGKVSLVGSRDRGASQ